MRLIALVAASLVPAFAFAQAWPAKPVRLIVNSAPGASVDLIARTFSPALGTALGQPLIVDNRAGGGGTIGLSNVAKASPDGYTLLHSAASLLLFGPLVSTLDVDVGKDLEPIAATARNTIILVARSGLGVSSAGELFAMARANPGKLNFGSGSLGLHVATERVLRAANVKATHVPYKGVAQMVNDLVGGQIDFGLDPGTTIPHSKAGKVRLLAIATGARSSAVPDLPTLAEAGMDVHVGAIALIGLYGPTGLPKDIAARLHAETGRIMQGNEARTALSRIGSDAMSMPQPEFAAVLRRDRERYVALVKEANIKVE